MLEIINLNTGYEKKQVLFDINFICEKSKIVAVIGPNGSGKSTLLKTICGLIKPWDGNLLYNGIIINENDPPQNLKIGISFCPQGNRVFSDLSVKENLEIGGYTLKKEILKERIEEILELFPVLKARLKQDAGTLSGGERQMLAVSRALIPKPELLLLDEPSLGLAPNLLNTVFEKLTEINRKLGVTIIIIEQKVYDVLKISDFVYSLKLGKVAYKGISNELFDNKEKLKELFL